MTLNEKIFREYDIRGIADTDLNDWSLGRIAPAITIYLKERGVKTLSVGRDCRLSSERIFYALVQSLTSQGIQVVDVGLVPTPLLYFSVAHLKLDGGIMITGSHNPSEHNGFKIVLGAGTIFGEEIQKIRQLAVSKTPAAGTAAAPIVSKDILAPYLEWVTSHAHGPLPLRVVVDSGNGMGGIVAGPLYRTLGCEVFELFKEPDGRFPNHHPDPTVAGNLTALIAEVRRRDAHVGIAFDGDADRIGVVDRSGRILFGDELLVLYARDILKKHPGATIISEVKASHRLFLDIARHGGRPIQWKTA